MFSHFLRKLAALVRRSPGVRVEVGGLVWQVTPAGVQLFGAGGPDLPAWEKAGLVEVVKQNLQRTISRVRLPGGVVYVKQCRANTPRAFARELLRPAKARLEFENALALRALGLAAIEPLAWGASPGALPGESYLVTRAEDAEPFAVVLERLPTDDALRRELARRFAAFMAQLHDAGVTHPDPHPGNVLLDPTTLRFILADVHAIHFGVPLAWPVTLANLVLLNRWFQLRATRTDRLRFWKAYLNARVTCPKHDADPKAIEAATAQSNERFWTARISRYTANNRDSVKVRGPAANGFAVRDLPPEVVRDWLADPDAVFTQSGVRILKDSRTSTVAELVIGTRTVIYKRFNVKSRLGPLKNLLRPSPALRSWILGHSLRDRGLPTARPLAMFQRHSLGAPTTGYVVFEKIPDAVTLNEAVEHQGAVRSWTERLGRLLRLMHERQVSHRDLKASNILMAGDEPLLIDLVGVEAGRPVPDDVRVRDLARLNASFLGSPQVTRTDRLRVLRAYRLWAMRGRGDWKSWWTRIAAATEAKVARNVRTGRPLA